MMGVVPARKTNTTALGGRTKHGDDNLYQRAATMRLVIFGVSNMLSEMLDLALLQGLTPSLVVMNRPQAKRPRPRPLEACLALFPNPPRVIDLAQFSPEKGECYFMGTTAPDREAFVDDLKSRFGIGFCKLIHPSTAISPRAEIGEGVYMHAFSAVGPGSCLAGHNFVGRNVSVGHDVFVDLYANLRVGCTVAGNAHVGRGAVVGMKAAVVEEFNIGAGAYVAAGAVVTRDVPAGALVTGVPAVIKKEHYKATDV